MQAFEPWPWRIAFRPAMDSDFSRHRDGLIEQETATSLDGSSSFSSIAAFTRTAQSLSASADCSTGVAAAAP